MTSHIEITPSSQEFASDVAIVTGAGSGIGAAVSRGLARRGAAIIAADINGDRAEETAASIVAADGTAVAIQADVSQSAASEAIVDIALRSFGKLTLAVNNVGVGSKRNLVGETDVEDWDRVIATTLSSTFYGMRFQLPQILRAGGGSVVNLTSIMGVGGIARNSAYAAAKHGVVGLTKSTALEYTGKGIRVNAVAPGYVSTPVYDGLTEKQRAALAERNPIGRLGEADEVAELILFLLSDRASFISGGVYLVDGAYAAGWMLGARSDA